MTRVREWKPGDVAMIRVPLKTQPGNGRHEEGNGDLPAVRTSSGGWAALDDVDYYWEPDYAFHDADPRLLVVIDPESDDVERLAEIFCSAYPNEGWVHMMRAALREFADPKPRIEEPTGLGAVVEDSGHCLWVRHDNSPGSFPWVRAGHGVKGWSEIDVVRVLSEGVTQ